MRPTPAPANPRSSIEKAHRKPRRASVAYVSDKARADAAVADEIAALVPLVPQRIIHHMLGGELGLRQVPDPARREAQLRRMLAARAGTDGASVKAVRAMLRDVRLLGYDSFNLTGEALDMACFPMSSALAHEVIASAHATATAKATGSQSGATVGDRMRTTLIFAADRLLWPIDVPRMALVAAAPKAKAVGKKKKAGVLPIAAKCQLEAIAQDPLTHLAHLTMEARAVVTFYARSFLSAGVDQSVRIAEGVRVELWPDETEPQHVMRGHAYMGKDGSPIDLYAPAEGFLGPYEWFVDHLRLCLTLGQVFPAWGMPKGSRGDIRRSSGFTGGVATKGRVRTAFKAMLTLPPMRFTDGEISAMNIQGHTGHATPPEWARCIGENPRLEHRLAPGVTLSPELRVGFSDRDIDVLGHWLRDALSKNEASASQAAASAEPSDARRQAAIASLPGKAGTKTAMRNYYGDAGSAGTRFSERWTQLRTRQRLVHIVRALLVGRDWRDIGRGHVDMNILRSDA